MLTSGILSSLHNTNSDLLDLHSTTADDSGVHSTSQDGPDSTIDLKPRGCKTHNSLSAAAALAVSKAVSNQGKFSIRKFQLIKRHKTRKPKKCSSCKEEFPTYADLEKHVKKDHLNFKNKCRYCPKTFNSALWKYQHQARHKGLRYQCSVDSCSNYSSLDTNFVITSKNTLKWHCIPAVLVDVAKDSLQNVLRPTIKSNIA